MWEHDVDKRVPPTTPGLYTQPFCTVEFDPMEYGKYDQSTAFDILQLVPQLDESWMRSNSPVPNTLFLKNRDGLWLHCQVENIGGGEDYARFIRVQLYWNGAPGFTKEWLNPWSGGTSIRRGLSLMNAAGKIGLWLDETLPIAAEQMKNREDRSMARGSSASQRANKPVIYGASRPGSNESVWEFTSPNGGGKIELKLDGDRLRVDIYSLDETVDINVSDAPRLPVQ